MKTIIDNSKNNLLLTHVRHLLDEAEFSSMAVGYFYLSGFEVIQDKLDKVKNLRLLIGNRTNQQTLEELVKGHHSKDKTSQKLRKQKRLNQREKNKLSDLTQQEYAEDLAMMRQTEYNEKGLSALWELIRDKKIDIRVYTKGVLHSKAYIFGYPQKNYLEGIAIVGSSNLSISGLRNNSELNITITNKNDYQEVSDWFEKLWNESEDFNAAFMDAVENSWFIKQVTPYDIYIKTLYHLVRDRIEIKEHSVLTNFDQRTLYPFQKDAFNRAVEMLENLDNPQDGVFVSDVVGLGKSYIAIALISYYWSVKQKSTLIICPASLKNMWEDYKDEFHLRCKVMSSSELLFPKGDEDYTLNDSPEYDGYSVVVIDESHNFRNPKTQRYKILAPYLQGRKVILLTATPQNNSVWDIYHQVKLFHQSDITDLGIYPNNLKKYFKAHEENPEKIAELLQHFLIRRTRNDIQKSPRYTEWVAKNEFPKRVLNTLDYDIEETYAVKDKETIYETILSKLFRADNKDGYSYTIYDLTSYVKPEFANRKEYIGLSNLGELVRGLLKVSRFKRLESSIESFYISIQRMIKRHDYLLASLERGFVVTGKAEQLELFIDSDDNPDDSKVNLYTANEFDVERLTDAIIADKNVLREVLDIVEPVRSNIENDFKFQVFINEVIEKHKGEKILVFSEFSDTVNYIFKHLKKLYPHIKTSRISSSVANSKEKASIVRRFSPKSQTKAGLNEYEEEIQFLITTDVLSEGQNLQDCSVIVNYDFHWNPVRLIQRIGRVDRIGSTSENIQVYNFLPDKKIEQQLDLRGRVQTRINEIQQIFGLDSKVLSEEEILNNESVFAIYSDLDESILDANDSISTIFDKAEQTLQSLKSNNLEKYNEIINLQDGVRTACISDKKGVFAYLKSGNLHRLYFQKDEEIIEGISEVLELIEATPNAPKRIDLDTTKHNEALEKIYEHFKEELKKRREERIANQIPSHQKHFRDRLQDAYNLFSVNTYSKAKLDELYNIFSKEVPDYAKSQLLKLRRENLSDELMLVELQKLVDKARIRTFQEKELEAESMIIRTICSEGFL